MRKRWWMVVAPPAFLLFIALGGFIVMQLWNWLMPPLFGWSSVTFWQALGLLALSRILFGGFGGHRSHDSRIGRRMAWRWQAMTAEEREEFRRNMRRHCRDDSPGGDGPSTGGSPSPPAGDAG